ncbi:MAG: lysophospholipid acyltransferase family protein [Candidatus Azobacteroides sp.]|nr:lysophospholipid acyltransferase family protein [Candidatus Azobacteroides sp.]
MIEAQHTWFGKMICNFYSGYKLERNFKNIFFSADSPDKGLPVLLIANHFSWWDSFIPYRLNRTVFQRKFHAMMLEEQLEKNRFLSGGGAFSVKKNSREIVKSLDYCLHLLKDRNNLVLLFPQGKIESLYTADFRFQKGIIYLLRHVKNDIHLFFNINMIEYMSERKPSLHIYFKEYQPFYPCNIQEIEQAYNEYFDFCKLRQQEKCIQ